MTRLFTITIYWMMRLYKDVITLCSNVTHNLSRMWTEYHNEYWHLPVRLHIQVHRHQCWLLLVSNHLTASWCMYNSIPWISVPTWLHTVCVIRIYKVVASFKNRFVIMRWQSCHKVVKNLVNKAVAILNNLNILHGKDLIAINSCT